MNTTAAIVLIVRAAILFNRVLARERAPQEVAAPLLGVSDDPPVMLPLINLPLFFLGMFMEALAIMVLTLNLMLGLLHPPMGIGLFVVSKVGNIPYENPAIAVLPPFVPLFVAPGLITVFPQITRFLPNLVYGTP